MLEKILPHEGVIALGVVFSESHILVHVEGDHVLETDLSGFVKAYQGLVETKGG